LQPLLPEFLKTTIEKPRADMITKNDLRAKADLAIEGSLLSRIDAHLIGGPITTVILDIESAHMIKAVTTCTAIIKGTGTAIVAIGGPGINGTDIEENIPICINMDIITTKTLI